MCALARVYAGTGQGNGAENMLRPSVLWRRFYLSSPPPLPPSFPWGSTTTIKPPLNTKKEIKMFPQLKLKTVNWFS